MGPVRRRIGRIGEENKGCCLGERHRESIVQHQAIHSTTSFCHGVRPCGDLFRFAFSIPLYRDKTLGLQLLLRGGCVVFCARRASLLLSICFRWQVRRRDIVKTGRLRVCCTACPRMLEYTEVSSNLLDVVLVHRADGRTLISCAVEYSRILCVLLRP
jgi:hypothetical protein